MFASAAFLALVNERLVGALLTPLFDKFGLDKFYLMYVAWVTGGVLCYFSGLDLFADAVPNLAPIARLVLTAVAVGGGSNLLHDIFDAKNTSGK
jgi:hypothetical protein